ncbi:MAG TPA: BREX system Lon protease-like protein BrxL, partial [Gemmatales bacterium]|nr:BREX system Lon protease-like protein BrxL [Gemmatales bacterium]
MSVFDEHPLSPLDLKAREAFGDQVVVKALAGQAAFHRLPRYVSEYLIAKFVKPDSWKEDLERVKARIKDSLPELEQRELIKERLMRTGEITLIDAIDARVDLRNQQRWARVPALNDDRVRVSGPLLEQHPGLLLGGLWGTARLRFTPEVDSNAPIELVAFTPFQVGPPDVEGYKRLRTQFSTEEWIALMLQSAGYEATAFSSRRQQLLMLLRLVPLVERNVNLIELGPRQTGKTFLLRNVSPRVFVISGGKTTPANLFVNLNTRAVGILGTRKVVVFDEIAHTSFGEEGATISTLKDYMESGNFSRGSRAYASDASIVMAGNIDVEDDQPALKYRHYLEPLPRELVDSAFIDRVHAYLPGWEIPKITPASLAKGVGFVTDFFGEVLARLRDEDHQPRVRSLGFAPSMTRRDTTAVERIGSGLLKLIHPDGQPQDEELHEIVALACEMRQRVHQQLCEIAPGEFKPRLIACTGLTGHAARDLSRTEPDLPVDDPLNREAVVGAVTGLGVEYRDGQPVGGSLILVQVAAINGASGIEVTGQHGAVLRDSIQTAYNIVRRHATEFGVPERRFREQKVAVHLVRIAEPKEGPSAGVAFVTGIVSALTRRPVRPGGALTG